MGFQRVFDPLARSRARSPGYMMRREKTKAKRATDSMIPMEAKHLPKTEGSLRDAWIPVAQTLPW